jgi:predicted TIM-barrel fold metal-dependent hydrolase
LIVDAQVHAYAADNEQYPWARAVAMEPPEVTGDQMVAAMSEVAVDAAILVSAWSTYSGDTRYAEAVFRDHPDRFRLVAPLDPRDDGISARVEEWAATPGAVGVRIFFMSRTRWGADHPGLVELLRAATAAGLVVNVYCAGRLPEMHQLARAFPNTQFVLDHLGMEQPTAPPAPPDALADLDRVLALARFPNLAVKFTGACTYSALPFPYDDLRAPLSRVIDAFGIDRCLWGSDWQRATRLLGYGEAVRAFTEHWSFTGSERDAFMAGNTLRIYGWDVAS